MAKTQNKTKTPAKQKAKARPATARERSAKATPPAPVSRGKLERVKLVQTRDLEFEYAR